MYPGERVDNIFIFLNHKKNELEEAKDNKISKAKTRIRANVRVRT